MIRRSRQRLRTTPNFHLNRVAHFDLDGVVINLEQTKFQLEGPTQIELDGLLKLDSSGPKIHMLHLDGSGWGPGQESC